MRNYHFQYKLRISTFFSMEIANLRQRRSQNFAEKSTRCFANILDEDRSCRKFVISRKNILLGNILNNNDVAKHILRSTSVVPVRRNFPRGRGKGFRNFPQGEEKDLKEIYTAPAETPKSRKRFIHSLGLKLSLEFHRFYSHFHPLSKISPQFY